jgi:hypothetical protein
LGIRSGFGFLGARAGFDIAEHLITYTVDSSNLDAFYVGLINTIVVSVFGIIFEKTEKHPKKKQSAPKKIQTQRGVWANKFLVD